MKYFAGWAHCDDQVAGGEGDTIEDAISEYFGNYAEYEVYYFGLCDGETMTVEVWSTMSREEAISLGLDGDLEDDWDYILDKPIEKRDYKISIKDGETTFIPQNAKEIEL